MDSVAEKPIIHLIQRTSISSSSKKKRRKENYKRIRVKYHVMCGVFGFILNRPVRVYEAVTLLEILEQDKTKGEKYPVGGYGAGVAFLTSKSEIKIAKVGKTEGSPSRKLYRIVSDELTRILIAHVRFPSPEFMQTSGFKETAQPYLANCNPRGLVVASVHNGKVDNYKRLKQTLKLQHIFESEKIELIDSEVIPHFFEELVLSSPSTEKAVENLFSILEGNNTVGLLHVGVDKSFLHLFQKGKTRGLIVWTNTQNEVIFCSRNTVVEKTSFKNLISKGNFQEVFHASYGEAHFWKHSFFVRSII